MRCENISDALGMLDEEMILHTDALRERAAGNKKKHWGKWWAVAACFLCVVGAAAGSVKWQETGGALRLSGLPDIVQTPGQEMPGETMPFVEIEDLLLADASGGIQEQAMEIKKIPVDSYMGLYEKVENADSAALAISAGEAAEGTEDIYRVLGHRDRQYLICKEEGAYSLWKFQCFVSEEYPYGDVLRLVYGLDSAEGIAKIKVTPPRMDNTDEGRRIQEEIGSRSVTDREDIEIIYQTLQTLTCYGSDRWDLIDHGNVEADAAGGLSDHRAVTLGRCLSLVTDYGNEIDGLKYTAVSDMFYEFSGIAYNRLTEEQAEAVRRVLGIVEAGEAESPEARGEKSLGAGEEKSLEAGGEKSTEAGGKKIPEAGGEEDGGREIEGGSTEGELLCKATDTKASLEDVTDLQERVSAAMVSGELPVVTVSAVYEKPYRLHVEVTSRQESDLMRLQALDTTGGLLEIVYVSGNAVWEKK